MLTWAHRHGIALRLIEPGKPNQNAYIESFNGRLRDECLNEHWFVAQPCPGGNPRMGPRIQRGKTEESTSGGLTPAQHAKQLAEKAVTFETGLKQNRYSTWGTVGPVHPPRCLEKLFG